MCVSAFASASVSVYVSVHVSAHVSAHVSVYVSVCCEAVARMHVAPCLRQSCNTQYSRHFGDAGPCR
eukprot:9115095-Alexandrium_andersonii.AAC.1